MARGWESKNVEQQQADASQGASNPRRALTPEERALEQRRRELQLAIARTQAELTAACRPPHREMLWLRLQALQEQLSQA